LCCRHDYYNSADEGDHPQHLLQTIIPALKVYIYLTSIYSAGRHLIGFLLFLCLTIFTAMVIPRNGTSSRSSGSSTAYQLGDLVEMAKVNMTVALRHEALAACFLLPPSAAAA